MYWLAVIVIASIFALAIWVEWQEAKDADEVEKLLDKIVKRY